MSQVLLVEDDEAFAEECLRVILQVGLTVHHCKDALSASQHIQKNRYEVALLDLMLPPSFTDEGLWVQELLLARNPDTQIILMTTRRQDTLKTAVKAMERGALDFIDKNAAEALLHITARLQQVVHRGRKRIFISYGQNELLRLRLQSFVEDDLGVGTVVLRDEPNRGLTTVEKLEQAAIQCRFALILLTKDDGQPTGTARARQDVVHEIGFFQGKYGRRNVVLLAERGVELFSNISNIAIEFESDHFDRVFVPLRVEIGQAGLLPRT